MTQQDSEKVCFVIAPIGSEGSPERFHSNIVLEKIIKPATQECGYRAIRADEIAEPGIITQQIIQHVSDAPLVIANLANQNPNVFYELALRHTLEKPVILIAPKGLNIPFDIAASRTIFFDLEDANDIKKCRTKIIRQIQAIEDSPENYYNPISLAIEVIESRAKALYAPEDVQNAFNGISDLQRTIDRHDLRTIMKRLRDHHIETKGPLSKLTSHEVLETIRALYREELLRPEEYLLDIDGIIVWGSYLVYNGNTEEKVQNIRIEIHKTEEYARKHGDLIIVFAKYGAHNTWVDVSRIVISHIKNNKLRLLVATDIFGIADPIFGVKKSLMMQYIYKGLLHSIEFAEDQVIQIPEV